MCVHVGILYAHVVIVDLKALPVLSGREISHEQTTAAYEPHGHRSDGRRFTFLALKYNHQ